MTLVRRRHWTDHAPDALKPRRRQRKIGQFINYRSPGGVYLPAVQGIDAADGTPDDWQGSFDFRDLNVQSALHFFAHDTTDAGNRAMVGMRLDEHPNVWVNIKARSPAPSATVRSGATVAWPNLWTNSTLRWTHAHHIARKDIILSAPGHPPHFEFSLRNAPGTTLEIADGIYKLRDRQGVVRMQSQPVYGEDANGNRIRCSFTQTDTWGQENQFPIVRVRMNATDMASAVYPVKIDPTTTISGSANINDTYLHKTWASGNSNRGADTEMRIQWNSSNLQNYRGLLRYDESLIPAGTISAHRLLFTNRFNGSTTSDTAYMCEIADANTAWVEGTSTGAAQAGSCCWNYLAYDASTPTSWAGSAGMATATTDYTKNEDYPTPTTSWSANTEYTWALNPSWATDWRDTPSDNNGLITHAETSHSFLLRMYTTNHGTAAYRPYFEIDYALPGGQAPRRIRTIPHYNGKATFRRPF